jgi:hypothetical protein
VGTGQADANFVVARLENRPLLFCEELQARTISVRSPSSCFPVCAMALAGARVDCFPPHAPSPNSRRVGIRIITFDACSGFTHITDHRIAQPPKATFVTRLRPLRSPGRAARQLPDQPTILWVVSSSTGDSRLRGALPTADIVGLRKELRRPRIR